jgi:indole-3-glycerol phosphate synthase
VATRLDSILAYHRERAARDDRDLNALLKRAGRAIVPPSLLTALVRPDREEIRVIAEVKRRSPSAGVLRQDMNVGTLAAAYDEGGAAAISVLTDEPHFGGQLNDIAIVRDATLLPVLRKDFTVCAQDVCDARLMGASAVLLIVAALARAELRTLFEIATALGLTSLVEVHDAREQALALDLGALVVGVNQRDLTTFEVDPERAAALASTFPSDVVTVAESGIRDARDARRFTELGYDAILVGEAFVRSADPARAVADFREASVSGAAA